MGVVDLVYNVGICFCVNCRFGFVFVLLLGCMFDVWGVCGSILVWIYSFRYWFMSGMLVLLVMLNLGLVFLRCYAGVL